MKTAFLLPALCCAFFTANLPAATPDERRDEADKLVEKAKQAKTEGRPDEANQLMSQAKKIQAELRAQAGDGEPSKGGDMKRERMKQEIGELQRAGQHEEAARRKHQFAEGPQHRAGEGKKGPQAEGPERIRHILQAVEHLRAAGLKEPAQNLEKMAHQMREELERGGASAGAGAGQMEHALREMHEGMERLRQQMEKMQRQIEELRTKTGQS